MSMVLPFCFHGIGSPQRPLEEGEEDLWLEPGQFEFLLDELQRHARVELTFDDGNASDKEHGLPALQERGLTGAASHGGACQPSSTQALLARLASGHGEPTVLGRPATRFSGGALGAIARRGEQTRRRLGPLLGRIG